MTSITKLAEAEKLLQKYIPLAKQVTGKNITLDRMHELMDALGNPQKQLNIVHIAGTSGKTSTAYFISQLLALTGNNIGLTVSPHVDSVMERIQVNNKILPEQEFTNRLQEFVTFITHLGIEPTYFELLIGFAYWYFSKVSVDYAVIETGMGGLQDGTNIADNSNKLCVITDIGFDHMHVLGNTITEIARQKAGIIHPSNEVFMYRQSDEVMEVFEKQCSNVRATLHVFDQNILEANSQLPTLFNILPEFQKRNWLLAYEVYKFLLLRDALPELKPEQLEQTTRLQVPGRMDYKKIKDKTIILDGAHNEQKMEALIRSLRIKFPHKKMTVLLSLKAGKEFATVLPLLRPITDTLIITSFNTSQDLPAVSIDPHELAKAAEKFGFDNVTVEPNQDKAYNLCMSTQSTEILITGSFYLLGQLRSKHGELKSA